MSKGRHASDNQMPFLRDLSIMGLVILVVALIVFGGISFLVNVFGDDTPIAADTSTTTTQQSTTSSSTSTTTSSTTTTQPTTTTTSTVTTIRPNADVRVLVLNSTSTSGLAARFTQRLSDLGYDMLEPDNHSEALEQSRVWYRTGFGAEALELAAQVPDAKTERLGEGALESVIEADIVVVLGASFEE